MSGDSTSALHDGSADDDDENMVLLAVAVAACARAAGVEDTAACAGRKELSDGVRFKSSNALELGPTDVSSEVDAASSSSAEEVEGSCMEDG